MSRSKKDGVFFNCYMSADVHDALVEYAAETGLSKTVIVEKAVAEYVMCKKPVDRTVITDFVAKYKSGQYVYPQAVVKGTGIVRAEVIDTLNSLSSLEPIRDYRCPHCLHSNLETNIDDDGSGTFFCSNCDAPVVIPDGNVDIVYRVK